jgi:hypothetical protein
MCVFSERAVVAQGGSAPRPKPGAKASAKAPAGPKLDLVALKKTLETGDQAAVLSALGTLATAKGTAGAEQAAPLVNELLQRGSNLPVMLRALEVTGELAQSSSTPPVLTFLRHRSTALRRGAATALGTTGGADATAGLRRALHDGNPGVRQAAVKALERLGAREAVPDLFLVLFKPAAACDCAQGDKACHARCDKTGASMPEAAEAIGALCDKNDCQKLVDLVGKLPFELIERGLRPILLRPETEVAEAFKLDVIDRMRRLQTKEARLFLQTVRAAYADKGSPHVRLALDNAVEGKPVPKPKP